LTNTINYFTYATYFGEGEYAYQLSNRIAAVRYFWSISQPTTRCLCCVYYRIQWMSVV